MEITQQVRVYAKKLDVEEDQVREQGMVEKANEFTAAGGDIYVS